MRRTIEKYKMDVIDYISKNNFITMDEIEKSLHVNIHRLFGGIKQAYEASEIDYPQNKIEFDKQMKEDLKKTPFAILN